jgi:hypothetical protein
MASESPVIFGDFKLDIFRKRATRRLDASIYHESPSFGPSVIVLGTFDDTAWTEED